MGCVVVYLRNVFELRVKLIATSSDYTEQICETALSEIYTKKE